MIMERYANPAMEGDALIQLSSTYFLAFKYFSRCFYFSLFLAWYAIMP